MTSCGGCVHIRFAASARNTDRTKTLSTHDGDDPGSDHGLDTPPTLSPPSEPGGAGQARRRSTVRLAVGLGIAAFLGICAIAMAVIELPYWSVEPGSVRSTVAAIDVVDGAQEFPPESEIGFVTVRFRNRLTIWEWVAAELDDEKRVVHEDQVTGGRTVEERRELERLKMEQSQDVSVLVALDYLGYDLNPVGFGVGVAELTPCLPAEDVLRLGDIIVGIDGAEVEFAEDLLAGLEPRSPGDTIVLSVDREGSEEFIDVPLVLGSSADECLPDDMRSTPEDERAMVGISMNPLVDYEPDVDVDIETGRVGGPSAGLAFTLTVIDLLTAGDLTGGLQVATTGEIASDGSIVPIGEVALKVKAVERAGFDVFLVPDRNYDEAAAAATDVRVVAVTDVADAVAALTELGGDAVVSPVGDELADDGS